MSVSTSTLTQPYRSTITAEWWEPSTSGRSATSPENRRSPTPRTTRAGWWPPTSADTGLAPTTPPFRAVYVEPTLASVGHTLATARRAGIEPISASAEMRTAAVRSSADGQAAGWITLLADPQSECLIGATGMGQNAEEWIVALSHAIRASTPVSLLADVVHPFPSFGEVLENPLWELREALHTLPANPASADRWPVSFRALTILPRSGKEQKC
jgi:hypothetical protein